MPPPEVLAAPAQLPKVINRTNGAVSDADVQKWVTAFFREQQIELWAHTNDQPGLLQGGCLGNPAANLQLFGQELREIETARASNRRIVSESASRPSVALVTIPPDVSANIRAFDGAGSAYALVIEIQGPGGTYYVDASGTRTPIGVIKSTDHYFELVGGEYKESSIGSLWFQDSYFACSTSWLRATCGV